MMKFILPVFAVSCMAFSLNALADNHSKGAIEAYAFATAASQSNGAAFLTLHNDQAIEQHVTGAATDIAEMVELHTMSMDGDVMEMREVEHFIVPANGVLTLKPTGDHVMLMGLKAPLVAGESFAMDVQIDGNAVPVDVQIVAPGTKPMEYGHAHGVHHDGEHQDGEHAHDHSVHHNGEHDDEHHEKYHKGENHKHDDAHHKAYHSGEDGHDH